jgi:hypothetical protein
MIHRITFCWLLVACTLFVRSGNCQIPLGGVLDDSVISIVYRQGDGNLSIDTAGELLTTFELVSTEDDFLERSNQLPCDIVFCTGSKRKIFELNPNGLTSYDFGPRVLSGLSADTLSQRWSVAGALMSGMHIDSRKGTGAPVDLFVLDTNLYGDFDSNRILDAADIDILTNQVMLNARVGNPNFDLNDDSVVNQTDRHVWVHDLAMTWYGDANLDGVFDSGDFVDVFTAAEYEDGLALNSTWATGDWNGDREFDSGDFVIAFQDNAYEKPRPATMNVPEPSACCLAFVSIVALLHRQRES